MRRSLIIHQSPPACWVKASHTTQDTVNQEDTQNHPQRAQANHGTATPPTPPTPKARTHTETNLHQPKAGQTMGRITIDSNITNKEPIREPAILKLQRHS